MFPISLILASQKWKLRAALDEGEEPLLDELEEVDLSLFSRIPPNPTMTSRTATVQAQPFPLTGVSFFRQ